MPLASPPLSTSHSLLGKGVRGGGTAESASGNIAPELKMLLEQVERLTGENQRLKAEQHRLPEQFARCASTPIPGTLPRSYWTRRCPRWTGIDRLAKLKLTRSR